jgi:enediyne biosynthesis protein E4
MNRCYYIFLLIIGIELAACKPDANLFELLPPAQTGIYFENRIDETDDFNILTYEYIYNGAGVAAGDFNGNGYPDLFFVGNMTQNRLYINLGDYTFTDVTSESGIGGRDEKWYSGISVVDINNNGLLDIYVSATGRDDPELRRNELYINQGVNENGLPVFVEMAAEYGLDDTSYSTQAYFFDYNNNGQLDMYLLVAHSASPSSYTNISTQRGGSIGANRDKLFESVFDDELGHPVFKDVSTEAGINRDGYGLGVNILDINGNGFKDIYVANDYISEDLFWINNGDGTFTNKATELFKHFSFSAMGTDAGDLNNNGRLDIFTLDMLPHVNVRRKMMANPNNYRNYLNNAFEGYHPQYTRNTLQMNLGAIDSTGLPVFSEAALLAGVSETDWSWAALLADLDNDGYRDIFVTNGIPRDVTDKDFWNEYGRVRNIMPMSLALPKIPEVRIPNFIFRNNGVSPDDRNYATFSDFTGEWGIDEPTFSTGAVYADLNNNGALDLVINNINQPAYIYRNRLIDRGESEDTNWLKIQFTGPEGNTMGLGAKVDLYFGTHHQTYEHSIHRGYLSSVDPKAHFGLGNITHLDSLIITWPRTDGSIADQSGKMQKFKQAESNRILVANYSDASISDSEQKAKPDPIFKDVTLEKGITYQNIIQPYDGFSRQPLLPYQLSAHGVGFAKGDLSGNGLEDLFIGGSAGEQAVILYHQQDGTFREALFEAEEQSSNSDREDSSILIFDSNGNGLNDIYIVSGGVRSDYDHLNYEDRLYSNNGDGTFTLIQDALPPNTISGSVVTGADFNGNGKIDLFIGGRLKPGRYPEAVSSLILRNDSDGDSIKFTDVTDEVAPMLRNFGIVNDATWTDINNNGAPDLVIAAEWKSITFLENRDGVFSEVTDRTGVNDYQGLWFSITETDLTGNGYPDFIVGNMGLNSLLRASSKEPLSIYFGDLTADGFFEAIPTIYVEDTDGIKKEFPFHNREDLFRHMPEVGSRFTNHEEFGRADMTEVLTGDQIERATVKRINHLESSVLINKGDGTFTVHTLPISAQTAPIFGILAEDIDQDGNIDLLISGNLFDADLQTGSYNSLNGLYLRGDGSGFFKMDRSHNSGFRVRGDGRSMHIVNGVNGEKLIPVLQHNGLLKMYEFQSTRIE